LFGIIPNAATPFLLFNPYENEFSLFSSYTLQRMVLICLLSGTFPNFNSLCQSPYSMISLKYKF
jgi:hypothetical protein